MFVFSFRYFLNIFTFSEFFGYLFVVCVWFEFFLLKDEKTYQVSGVSLVIKIAMLDDWKRV